jgi:hypothetical protein
MTGAPVRVAFDLANGRSTRVTITLPTGPVEVLERAEPFAPDAAALAEFAGTYRSDEIEPVYRLAVKDGQFRLERLKMAPALLTPLVKDTFMGQLGIIRFVRGERGLVTGFVLEGGRVRRMKFSKVTPPGA